MRRMTTRMRMRRRIKQQNEDEEEDEEEHKEDKAEDDEDEDAEDDDGDEEHPPHLIEVVLGDVQGRVEEVQDVAGVLDAVLGRLLGGGETVVAGAAEILVTAGAVLEPVGLPGHDGVLLGHTAGGKQTETGQKTEKFTPKTPNLSPNPRP